MTMNQRPPKIDINFADLPSDSRQRHEVLVDVFGRYIMWLRDWTTDASRELVESEEARQKLGTIRRRKYDAIAQLSPDQRAAACTFAQATVDRFLQLFLTLLAGRGVDDRLGTDHAIRFKLDMEIVRVEDGEIVDTETINRSGKKFFADYWGRWLNRFASQANNANDSNPTQMDNDVLDAQS
jgi:hypothetical protein